MSLPRSVAEILREHVTLEIECMDRMYLNVYIPQLQREGGVASFFRFHRGHPFASSVLMDPISKAFIGAMERFAKEQKIPVVTFRKGERKDDIAARRDLLTRFLKASIEGNYIALTDAKRAKEVLAKELKIANAKILDITYNDFKQQSPQNLEPSLEGAQNILKLFPNVSQKIGDYIDVSLLDGLKNDGFFAAMAKKYGLQNP